MLLGGGGRGGKGWEKEGLLPLQSRSPSKDFLSLRLGLLVHWMENFEWLALGSQLVEGRGRQGGAVMLCYPVILRKGCREGGIGGTFWWTELLPDNLG